MYNNSFNVEQIPCTNSSANMYLLKVGSFCWAIDVGDSNGLLTSIGNNMILKGIFITHPHYDHIQGINEVSRSFPNCTIYGSAQTLSGLRNSKLNLSYYHGDPIVYQGNLALIFPEKGIQLSSTGPLLTGIHTPGHFEGSITYLCSTYLFTGDSFIPGIPVVTKLKTGNRLRSYFSLKLIRTTLSDDKVVCPGHGAMKLSVDLSDLDFPDLNNFV